MKRLLLRVLSLLLSAPLIALAAPSSFEVSVKPNPLKVSEFGDVTVKALDANGNIATTTDSDIWIEIEGHDYTDPDIVLPGNGIGFFEAADQGVKIFSKGLSIKKPGTYTLKVVDVYDTNLKGSTTIQVVNDSAGPAIGGLTVTSPLSGSTEKLSNVNIVGTTTYANTPIVIMIDGVKAQETITDQRGSFTVSLSGLQPGAHTLVVNALDLTDKIVATSGPIPFNYQPDPSRLFLGLEILPGKQVAVRTKMTFTVKTDESVSSALLKFGDNDPIPTTKQSPGVFITDMTFDTPVTYPIDVILSVSQQNHTFDNVETIIVSDELRKITSLVATPDPATNTVGLERTYIGKIDFFKVKYGTSQTDLRLSVTSSQPSAALLLAEPTLTYYAQVFPTDNQGNVNGEPSGIVKIDPLQAGTAVCGNTIIEPGETCDDGNFRADDGCSELCQIEFGSGVHNGAPASSCYPEGIAIQAIKTDDKYYIARSPVPFAREYQIYRSDSPVQSIDEMLMIGQTTDTKYEYPFDPKAKTEKYAWYAVRAVCDNEDVKPVGDMTKVKVGPEKALIILVLTSLFAFGLIRFQKAYR